MVVVVVVVIGLAAIFSGGDRGNESTTSGFTASRENGGAETMPTSRAGTLNVSAGGYVEPLRSAVLLPGNDGVVTRVYVSVGDLVKKDQLLLELESETAIADVAMAEADLSVARAHLAKTKAGARYEEIASAQADTESADAELEFAHRELLRQEALDSSRVVSPSAVEEARMRVAMLEARVASLRARENLLRRGSREEDIEAAEAELEKADAALRLARARFELSRVKAPFDGRIMRINLEAGDIVSRFGSFNRQIGIEIADLSELWVRIDVPETRIGSVHLGAPAEVVVDALGSVRLRAVVVEVAPIADRQSNTVEVAVRVEDPPSLLSPNMSARVTISNIE